MSRVRSLSLSRDGRGDRTRTYNRRFWRPVLCQLSYTPAAPALLGLAVEGVTPVTGTVFHELDPIRIVLLVLARRVRSLPALGALELQRGTRLDLGHRRLPREARDGTGTDGPAALADGEALADVEPGRGDQLRAHLHRAARHA